MDIARVVLIAGILLAKKRMVTIGDIIGYTEKKPCKYCTYGKCDPAQGSLGCFTTLGQLIKMVRLCANGEERRSSRRRRR